MKIIEDGNFTNAFSASVTIISVILMLIALLFVKDVHDWKFWALFLSGAIPGVIVSKMHFVKNMGLKPLSQDPVGLRNTQKHIRGKKGKK